MAGVIWNRVKLVLLLVLPALLAACGGGGSGQNPPPDGDGRLTFDVVDGRPVARIGDQVFQLLTEEEARISQQLYRQVLEAQREEGSAQGQAAEPLSLPQRVDLRSHQTPIRGQGSRGTCAAFAAVAVLEAAYKRDRGLDLDLSEQYAFQVNRMALLLRGPGHTPHPLPRTEQEFAFRSGAYLITLYFLRHYGVPPEEDMPYIRDMSIENISVPDRQWIVDEYNINQQEVRFVGEVRFTPLPIRALLNARYAPTQVRAIEVSLQAFKEALARGETILF
ncbi:C1 family peptidase, partial [Thermus sp.]|uniref:C1 family peptidase n=1 Tax=Thermus sp. TaxID=275 RepID=UPI00298F374A